MRGEQTISITIRWEKVNTECMRGNSDRLGIRTRIDELTCGITTKSSGVIYDYL
jgi:hypothetical protein